MKNMLNEFLEKKLREAKYKILKDRTYFGAIPGLKGVWANAKNLENCRKDLQEVLEDWLFLKVRDRESISGFKVKVDRRQLVKNA